jgi:hypothetical protein
MAWTASVFDKNVLNGRVIVVVQYSDGTNLFNETYETIGQPSTSWIENLTFNRLNQLNNQSLAGLPSTGIITPVNPTTLVSISTSQQDWVVNFGMLQKIDLLLKYNIISTTDSDILALKNYLTNNWRVFLKGT